MTAPRPTSTSAGPPRGRGPAWERPGARPGSLTAPRPTSTSAGPPRGHGPAWERPGGSCLLLRRSHAREVGRARARVQLAEQRVVPRRRPQAQHLALRIGHVAEVDRPRGAGGLAGGDHVAVGQRPAARLGVLARPRDALDAVAALLHHAALAHRDIGIALRLERLGRGIGPREEVEAAHLVRAVVRAEARADAAV